MIIFGGENYFITGRNETWILPLDGLPIWSQLHAEGTPPPPRSQPSVIYDSLRDRLILFGGYDGSQDVTDIWALSLSGTPTWSMLTASGSPPPMRYYRSGIYDPMGDRMILFGGRDRSNHVHNELWALSFADTLAWSQLTPSGSPPSARAGQTAIYDPQRERLVLFGGFDDSDILLNDTWSLTLSGSPAWTELETLGSPTPGRELHTAIYDSLRDRMVIFGGFANSDDQNDTWELPLGTTATWSQIAVSAPLPIARVQHGAIYDPGQDRMVIFGGYWGSNVYQNEAWELRFAGTPQWKDLTPVTGMPVGRYGHSLIYDPISDRAVLFGGLAGILRNDVWDMPLSGNSPWTRFADSGSAPSPREWQSAIYDPVRDRLVVFGGIDGLFFLNDVWAMNLGGTPAWSQLNASGTPPSTRYKQSAIYDPGSDRMIVFGGYDGNPLNDVWSLSLSGTPTWSQIIPSGTPPSPRYFHTATYDPVRHAMIVFGGQDGALRNDAWSLSLSGSPTWSPITASLGPPPARESHAALYDSQRDRLIVFGGSDGSSLRNDVWALSLSGQPEWDALVPDGDIPSGREGHTVIYDELHDRLVLVGGQAQVVRGVVWALSWGSLVGAPPARTTTSYAQLAARPNPFRSETVVDYTIRSPGWARLDVFDVAGRLVRELTAGPRQPGRYEESWDGRDRSGRRVRSGIYAIRVSRPDGSASVRVTELR